VFDELDVDDNGVLDASEIAEAFAGELSIPEVDAAVHSVLVDIAALHHKKARSFKKDEGKITFDDFMDFMSSENGLHSSLFQDRKRVIEDDIPSQKKKKSCFCFF